MQPLRHAVRRHAVPALAMFAASLPAQFQLVGPDNAYATQEGNSNFVFPWNIGTLATSVARVQFFQDSSVFTGQGVTTPIRITRLRYRADAIQNTWNGRTIPAVIEMSTCPVDYLAVTNTFASNHGPDVTTVFNGGVTVTPGVGGSIPGPWYVDIALTTPFVYDPTTGADLALDFRVTGAPGSGGIVDHVGGSASPPPLGSRVWDSNADAHTRTTATFVNPNFAPVCEFTYEPTVGLWANFDATPTAGTSPLQVQFTDRSTTSNPGGVIAWQWDLNGDSVVDSTLQNPTFTYTTCGSFNVTLTAIDAFGTNTRTRSAYIVTDRVATDFTWSVLPGATVQFTDSTTPAATAWAWDFNGDTITDSTLQNPVWVFPSGCAAFEVTLTASRGCGAASSRTQSLGLAPNSLTTRLTGGTGTFGSTTGNVFDLTVLNPAGINICAVAVCPYTDVQPIGTPITCEVYVTDAAGGFATNHNNAAVWRLAATGSGRFAGGNSGSPVPVPMALDRPIWLPAGSYALAVHLFGMGLGFSTGSQTFSNPDLSIATGGSKFGLFGASMTNARTWNGTLYYDTPQTGGSAGFGFFGAGCAGTLGIAGQSFTSLPQLGGALSLTVTRLPISAMFYMLGFSRTTSAFGPLPVSLAGFGTAADCFGRVSPDAVTFVLGGGNAASMVINVPLNPGLAGLELFAQPLVPDPGFNLLGATAGDAWAMVLGI